MSISAIVDSAIFEGRTRSSIAADVFSDTPPTAFDNILPSTFIETDSTCLSAPASSPSRPTFPSISRLMPHSSFDPAAEPRATSALKRRLSPSEIYERHSKKLCTSTEKNTFRHFVFNAPLEEREAMNFALLLSVESKLTRAAENAHKLWEPTKTFKDQLDRTVLRVLLSAKLGAYSGSIVLNRVLSVIKQKRWGLPADIHEDSAGWSNVLKYARNQITERRSDIKSYLKASFSAAELEGWLNTPDAPPLLQCDSIYELCQRLVNIKREARLTVTPQLAARVAFLRACYAEQSFDKGSDFWKCVDKKLAEIRKKAENNSTFVSLVFDALLKDDINKFKRPARDYDTRATAEQELADRLVEGFMDGDNVVVEDGQQDNTVSRAESLDLSDEVA